MRLWQGQKKIQAESMFFFTPEILEKLKFEAKKNGLSVSGYIRMIVIQRLNEESAN